MISLLLAAMALAAPVMSDRIQVSEVIGPTDVHVRRKKADEIIHAGEDLVPGDEVTVGDRQVVSLTAFDGSKWKLAPNTRFTAESRRPDKMNQAYWQFQITKGAMWGKVSKNLEDKEGFRLKVRTKSAALGIRGTEYLVKGDNKRSSVDVLEGTVWWGTDPNFASGSYKVIAAGSHGDVGADGRVNISETKGSPAKLKKDYGIELSDEAIKASGTAAECLARGKGWRSDNGSSLGECENK
jgi:hypothetical protein